MALAAHPQTPVEGMFDTSTKDAADGDMPACPPRLAGTSSPSSGEHAGNAAAAAANTPPQHAEAASRKRSAGEAGLPDGPDAQGGNRQGGAAGAAPPHDGAASGAANNPAAAAAAAIMAAAAAATAQQAPDTVHGAQQGGCEHLPDAPGVPDPAMLGAAGVLPTPEGILLRTPWGVVFHGNACTCGTCTAYRAGVSAQQRQAHAEALTAMTQEMAAALATAAQKHQLEALMQQFAAAQAHAHGASTPAAGPPPPPPPAAGVDAANATAGPPPPPPPPAARPTQAGRNEASEATLSAEAAFQATSSGATGGGKKGGASHVGSRGGDAKEVCGMRRLPGATVAGSGYRGVSKASKGMWRAVLWLDGCGRQQYLGQFATPVEAARAYDRAALRTKGARAVLNFPEEAAMNGGGEGGGDGMPDGKASPTSSAAELPAVVPRQHRASAKLTKRVKRALDEDDDEDDGVPVMSALDALLAVAQQACED